MGRALRETVAGYYHLVNRGVGLREVFLCREDNIFFIELICNYAKEYKYTIHSYALIANGYNILMETKKDNLSKIMKLVNAGYTSYFNRKYGRRGHLWEGRFKSWYVEDNTLLLEIIAYIEHLPINAGRTKEKEKSFYSSYRQFIGIDQRLPCIYQSIIFQTFNNIMDIKKFFNIAINIEYINAIHAALNKKNLKKEKEFKKKLPVLPMEYFAFLSTEEKNKKICQAYYEGYSQSKIGEILGISQQAVCKIIKKVTQV